MNGIYVHVPWCDCPIYHGSLRSLLKKWKTVPRFWKRGTALSCPFLSIPLSQAHPDVPDALEFLPVCEHYDPIVSSYQNPDIVMVLIPHLITKTCITSLWILICFIPHILLHPIVFNSLSNTVTVRYWLWVLFTEAYDHVHPLYRRMTASYSR